MRPRGRAVRRCALRARAFRRGAVHRGGGRDSGATRRPPSGRGRRAIRASHARRGALRRRRDLRGVDLRRGNLTATWLVGALLIGADLRGATLTYASLHGANLNGAVLDGANLRDATCDERTRWPSGIDWEAAGVRVTDRPRNPREHVVRFNGLQRISWPRKRPEFAPAPVTSQCVRTTCRSLARSRRCGGHDGARHPAGIGFWVRRRATRAPTRAAGKPTWRTCRRARSVSGQPDARRRPSARGYSSRS